MIKKILVSILLLQATYSLAQQSTSSPYSLYGLGLEKFNGSNASRGMAGLSSYSDETNLNLQNPATYADLKLTTFSVGASYTTTNIKAEEGTGRGAATTFDYLAIGIPAGKFGIGLGIVPYRAVGYDLSSSGVDDTGEEFDQSFEGLGNLNRLYLSLGSEVYKGLKLGAEFQYNFGRLEEQLTIYPETTFSSRFIYQSDISGVSYKLSAMYDFMLFEDIEVRTYLMYDGSGEFKASNSEERATVSSFDDLDFSEDAEVIDEEDRELGIPTKVTAGMGITKKNKWHLGGEAYIADKGDYTDRRLDRSGVVFTNFYGIKAGGFYIPKFNSLTSYFNRVTYRFGARYDRLGLVIDNVTIKEFGMSFGLGMPLPRQFSNLDVTFEVGSRGETTDITVKENFFSVSLGLSIGQKWFKKRKYD